VGPQHWGELDPSFSACASGKNQSPVDLAGFLEADLPPIAFDYASRATELLHNGHTVQATQAAGSTILVQGRAFELKQFHFHAPSENRVEGRSFPMEGHLVHADREGNIAVVAVLYTEGAPNEAMADLWKHLPRQPGERNALPEGVDPAGLLPPNRDYYRFNGSLTTPPCSEGVWWLVMKQPVTASPEQIQAFSAALGHANNRPVQAVNARPILR
jgi:carbonic anhydrase